MRKRHGNLLYTLTMIALFAVVGCNANFFADTDGDAVNDLTDNCPTAANTNQIDADADGRGDACDNCPSNSNADQADQDGDGFGAACDSNDLNPLIH